MFVEVVLPLPLADTYTYSVPPEMENRVAPGVLVLVEFGKSKRYSGIVAYIHRIKPELGFEIKPILAVESPHPILRRPQLRFWEWLSQYYLCKLGEVYKAVLPSGFRYELQTEERNLCPVRSAIQRPGPAVRRFPSSQARVEARTAPARLHRPDKSPDRHLQKRITRPKRSERCDSLRTRRKEYSLNV